MTTSKSIHRSVATLNLPKAVPSLITYAQGIVKGMTGNPAFATPSPALAVITEATSELQAAETAALARTKGAVATRNEKRTALGGLLEQLRAYIQAQADASMENGASIIQGAGIAVRKSPVRPPRVFDAKQGTVTGAAQLVAAAASRRASYEWQYSVDGGKTWITAPVTLQAKTTVTGLAAGTTVQFKYRPVTKDGEGDWSQPVSLLVK
ncbi:MAG TPA: fibronectin type III domain-containing protein [Polyangiaceae bacterium]|jgi:hypothetical protein|nr:fibronectin type III domain-containing protein [Polyangiaceae bacterium]